MTDKTHGVHGKGETRVWEQRDSNVIESWMLVDVRSILRYNVNYLVR
jgi:hypothetical protein